MLIVACLLGAVVIALAVVALGVRSLDAQVALLRNRVAKLVRLSVAVDDLHHETTQVVPAYRDAMTRVRTLRRTEDGEGSR